MRDECKFFNELRNEVQIFQILRKHDYNAWLVEYKKEDRARRDAARRLWARRPR